tara:strand:- start:4216 stop:4602 length:387 start_codon:yes stop_codon:yes gene_type:complete
MVDGKVPRKGSATAPVIGLYQMVRGLGVRNADQVDGCRESEVSLRVVDRRYGLLASDGFNTLEEPIAEGMQRGRAAGPLAKMCGTTTHILRKHRTLEKSANPYYLNNTAIKEYVMNGNGPGGDGGTGG